MSRRQSNRPVAQRYNLISTRQDDFSIVLGDTDKIWINDDGDGAIHVGGSTKSSAPFSVASDGTLTATGATIRSATSGDRAELTPDGLVFYQSAKFGGDSSLSFARGSGEIMATIGLDNFSLGLPSSILVDLTLGSVAMDLKVKANNISLIADSQDMGLGVGMVRISNRTTAPSTNPTGGGLLYAESGALKWRGSSGTVTTIANA